MQTRGKPIQIRGKLNVKDCGNPKLLLAEPETVKKLVLGILSGSANSVEYHKGPDGVSLHERFKGQFRATPYKESEDEVLSDILYLPPGSGSFLKKALEKGDEDGVIQAQFAFEVSVVRATNPHGYTWALEPILDNIFDPFKELNEKIMARRPQLSWPMGASPAAALTSSQSSLPEKKR